MSPNLRPRKLMFISTFVLFLAYSPLMNTALAQQGDTARVTEDSAQEGSSAASEQPTVPKLRVLPPAYEAQMLQLSKALGSLHYLRAVCQTGEGQIWREQMEKLLAAEQPDEQRRARMIAHFNRGFRGYAEIHFECNDAAVEAANRFLAQATRIAAEIPNRYGR